MSIFKDTFKEGVKKQLKVREDAINNRTPSNLTYYNSRNAWIRMTSAVDVGGDGGALAKKYIMQGGILNPSGKLRSGLGQDGAYSNVSPNGMPYGQVNGKLAVAGAAGIRPMPGITGIDIKTKSAYGSLREVTVNFNAWTIQQLEDLELLYMRPGYTAMVEWGWSPYLNNSGTLVNNVSFIDDVLNGGKTKEEIWKNIFTKASTDGNYDAIYGFIKNYGWSARMDGGYDCTVTIITMGELLESLKINYTAASSNVIKQGTFSEESITKPFDKKTPIAKSYGQNLLAGICNEMYEIAKKTLTSNNTEGNITLNGESYTFCRFDVSIEGREDTEDTFLDDTSQIYITLESLCRVLNKYVTLQDGSGKTAMVNLSTKEGDYTDDPGANLLCLGDIYQLSTDPSICLIKNDAWGDPASLGFKEGFSDDFSTIKGLMAGLKTSYWYNDIYSISSGLGVIGNIFVNLGYIYSLINNDELASQDKKEKKEIVLYDFIKNILKGVNGSIGNVATLELFIDPIDSVARIIDVNYVDSKKRSEAYKDAFTLQMHNLNSTVRSYKLESQIFPEQSTIVAIGAQVKGGALGTNTNTLVDFNQNLIDRIVKSKDDPTKLPTTDPSAAAAELETKIKNLKENIDIIVSYLNQVDADWYEFVGDFDVANASKYANALRDIINFKKEFVADDSKNRSIIPTKLSIEMDGIGGLIIGNMFKIPDDLLPRGYKGGGAGPAKITYLVTGIGHSVQNNDWVTKLDAQFNILDEPKGTDATKYGDTLAAIVKIASETDVKSEKEVKEAAEKVKKKIDGAKTCKVTKSMITFREVATAVIANLEGGYFHPSMLTDGRLKDPSGYMSGINPKTGKKIPGIRPSGETIFGIDRVNGADSRKEAPTAWDALWKYIADNNGPSTWRYNYPISPKGTPAVESKLYELSCQIMEPAVNKLLNRYVKNTEIQDVIKSDGRLYFNFVYAVWNGEGWFKAWAKELTAEYNKGTKDSEQLATWFIRRRINNSYLLGPKQSNNVLITQSGKKISKLTCLE
jgi:hypothetical protein